MVGLSDLRASYNSVFEALIMFARILYILNKTSKSKEREHLTIYFNVMMKYVIKKSKHTIMR